MLAVEITYFARYSELSKKKWTVYLLQNENYDPAGKIRLIEFLGILFYFFNNFVKRKASGISHHFLRSH